MRCFSWPILAGHGDERGMGYFEGDIFGGEDILVEENGRKGKRKIKWKKERYFLGSKSENN